MDRHSHHARYELWSQAWFGHLSLVLAVGCTSSNETGTADGTTASTGNGGATSAGAGGKTTSGGGGGNTTAASSSGAGGNTTASSSSGATTGGGQGGGPPHVVANCGNLGAEGVFEEITPPMVKAGFGNVTDGGGAFAFAVDPVNQGTIYLGTLWQGVWKSTDCGATWVELSSGMNGKDVSSGMNWTFAVDPIEPNVIYTNSGYTNNHLWKSSNAGGDWEEIWPPSAQPELAKAFQYNFANVVAIDPFNHKHILLTFHEGCLPPHSSTCIAESADSGASWKLVDGQAGWNGGEGQVIFFLNDSQTWLWGSQSNGYYRSGNTGTTWEQIPGMSTTHLQGTELARRSDGTFFLAGSSGVYRSSDGTASTWKLIENTGPIVGGLVNTGTNMYASTCWGGGACQHARLLRSGTNDGDAWTEVSTYPDLDMGSTLGYDSGHSLLYSSNMARGLWRAVMP